MLMNKKVFAILTVVLSLMSLTANAQLRFGVKGGIVLNKLSFDKSTFKSENRTGFAAGLQLDLRLPLGFALDGSVMYSHRNDRFLHESQTYRRDYIEIPIHVRYGLNLVGLSNLLVPYAFTGPNFAFLCAESKDITWENRSTFTSWDVGFGVELLRHVQVQASYGIGITDAFKAVGLSQSGDVVKGKDRCWTVTASYLF